jgi:peptide deformylase
VAEVEGQVKHDDGLLDAEAQARRRLALAQIRQFGDPVLRMQAQEVTEFDDDLQRLVDRMVSLMRDAQGVGLAGTQVGVLRRVFVFQADAEAEPQAIVNPVITERSKDADTDDEGCLSLQGVLVPVERPSRITLEGKTPSGEDVRLELEGLGARVVQHEIDHLDGVLIIDRANGEHRREALGILRPQPVLYVG